MISTKQKWLLGGLVPLCAAIWAPQLMERIQGDTSASVAADADLDMQLLETTDGPAPTGPGATGPGPTVPAPSGGAGTSARPAAAGGQLAGPEATLEAILATLRDTETFGGGPHVAGQVGSAASRALEAAAQTDGGDEIAFTSPMLSFVERHPLQGTLSGATSRFALFGSYRVTEGDTLPGTAATVVEVGRGRVVLDEGGTRLEVALPPLETDPARARAAAWTNRSRTTSSSAAIDGLVGELALQAPAASASSNDTGAVPPADGSN